MMRTYEDETEVVSHSTTAPTNRPKLKKKPGVQKKTDLPLERINMSENPVKRIPARMMNNIQHVRSNSLSKVAMISVKVEPDLYRLVKYIALKNDVSMSRTMRYMVKKYLQDRRLLPYRLKGEKSL
jgi:hypothetical protein